MAVLYCTLAKHILRTNTRFKTCWWLVVECISVRLVIISSESAAWHGLHGQDMEIGEHNRQKFSSVCQNYSVYICLFVQCKTLLTIQLSFLLYLLSWMHNGWTRDLHPIRRIWWRERLLSLLLPPPLLTVQPDQPLRGDAEAEPLADGGTTDQEGPRPLRGPHYSPAPGLPALADPHLTGWGDLLQGSVGGAGGSSPPGVRYLPLGGICVLA